MTHHLYLLSLLRHIPEPSSISRFEAVLSGLGMDRDHAVDLLDLAEYLARGGRPSVQANVLRSPLECLMGNTPVHRIRSEVTGLTDTAFPVSGNETLTRDPWKPFAEDRSKIPDSATPEVESEIILNLLHRYAAQVANPGGAAEEISWYDWAKSVAGIVVALQGYRKESPANQLTGKDKPFILIGGDLSGIQRYITAIVSKGASKNLKGRSFYLQMLTESVVTLLLDRLGLVRANVIYASGGSFYILAPNTKACQSAFDTLAEEITQKIYETHKNSLAIIMDYTEVAVEEMGQVQQCFERLMDDLEAKKRQKNPGIIRTRFREMFQTGVDTGGDKRRDAISGEEISELENFYIAHEESRTGYIFRSAGSEKTPNTDVLKTVTYEQVMLGQQLRKMQRWVFTMKEPAFEASRNAPEYFNPCGLGVYHFLSDGEERKDRNSKRPAEATVLSVNPVNGFLPDRMDSDNIYGFTYYGGNEAPCFTDEAGEPKVLEFSLMTLQDNVDIAEMESKLEKESSLGYFRRLAVLRMDVDNLGAVFRDEVPENRSVFAFYSALSRSLDWFFKGYLNTIWKNERYSERSQIIYSGGDDLFIVGRWDVLLRFARKISEDFRRYTGHNPHLGISGGLAVVTHKFPVIKASILAGVAEKKAKNHSHIQGQVSQKDALTLMGEPLRWRPENGEPGSGCEFGIVEYLKVELKKLGASNPQLGRGFCQRIQAYYAQKVFSKKQGQSSRSGEKYRWKWLIAYDFARLKDRLRLRDNSEEARFLSNLQAWTISDSFFNTPLSNLSQYDFMDILNVAARWAELEYRSQDKND